VLTYWQAARFRCSPLKGYIWRVQPTGGRNGWAVPLGGFLIATASFVLGFVVFAYLIPLFLRLAESRWAPAIACVLDPFHFSWRIAKLP
jgi:hypothetical protein